MKIICVGRNYIAHAKELGNKIPQKPLIFMKPPSALLVNDKPFYYPEFSSNIHYEVELVLKIGKNGRHIQAEFAKSYVVGIGLGIDFTARDIQSELKEKGHPWELAKGFDNSAVLSNIFPFEDFDLNTGIAFGLKKNNQWVQQGNTNDMLFSVTDLLVYTSQYFKLQVGDLFYTGTPSGVGPIKIGDVLEGYLEDKLVFTCAVK